jgi:hypothetical protein
MLENLIYAESRELFESALNSGKVSDDAVVFIKNSNEIWSRGNYFKGWQLNNLKNSD